MQFDDRRSLKKSPEPDPITKEQKEDVHDRNLAIMLNNQNLNQRYPRVGPQVQRSNQHGR